MTKAFIAISVAILAVPATAQDFTGNVNPSAYSQPMVMTSAINAQARNARRGYSAPRASASDAAQTCAELPRFRATRGANDAKVLRLTQLCRQAGY